jgi:hypothetical protein
MPNGCDRRHCDEGLAVRAKPRKRLANRPRVLLPAPTQPNERWIAVSSGSALLDGDATIAGSIPETCVTIVGNVGRSDCYLAPSAAASG